MAMIEPIVLEFSGPLSWLPTGQTESIFDATVAKRRGIYLWAVQTDDDELIYYVGETGRTFAARMTEHLRDQMSGMYHIFDPDLFVLGEKKPLWHGMYGSTRESGGLADFVGRLPGLAPSLVRMVQLMRFWVAPLECDQRVRQGVEAAIASYLYGQIGLVGTFQDDRIHYRARSPDDEPLPVIIRCSGKLRGLPKELTA